MTYVLKHTVKQWRSEKSGEYARDLVKQLRIYHETDLSTYRLTTYYTIDDLKSAVFALKNGDTIEIV